MMSIKTNAKVSMEKLTMKKNKILVSVVATALLGIGAMVINDRTFSVEQNIVQASKRNKIRLVRNSYVYKPNGKRYGLIVLRKGSSLSNYGKRKINGNFFYSIGKGKYVKAVNIKKADENKTVENGNSPFSYRLVNDTSIYDSNGQKIIAKILKKNQWVIGSAYVIIDGQDYVQIDHDQFVKAEDLRDRNGKALVQAAIGKRTANSNRSDKKREIKEDFAGYVPDGYTYENGSYHYYDDDQDYYQEALAGSKKHDMVFFTPAQVKEIENYLWEDIQNYRKSFGLSGFKHNVELANLLSKISPFSYTANTDLPLILNTSYASRLAPYLPKLSEQGMSAGTTMFSAGGFNGDIRIPNTARKANDVADSIFNGYKNLGYDRLFKGYNDRYAYMEVGLFYDPKGHCLSVAIGEVAGTSPDWVNAWNEAN